METSGWFRRLLSAQSRIKHRNVIVEHTHTLIVGVSLPRVLSAVITVIGGGEEGVGGSFPARTERNCHDSLLVAVAPLQPLNCRPEETRLPGPPLSHNPSLPPMSSFLSSSPPA